jgi:hypothetical protein
VPTSKSQSTTTTPAAAHAAEAAASRLRLDEAKAQAEQDYQAFLDADERQREVLSSRTSTGEDLAAAEAALRLAERRKAESAAAVAAAERALVNDSTDLAEALIPFVEEVLGLMPMAQSYQPTEPLPAPTVVLVQRKASKLDARTGSLAGEVEIHLHRHRFHRELAAAAFQSHAERHGGPRLSAYPLTATEQDGVYVEAVRLVVASAFPALPVVAPGNDERGLHNLAADLVAGVVGQVDHVALDTSRKILSDQVSGGTRTVAVQVAVVGSPTRKGTSTTAFGEAVRYGASLDTIREAVGRVALGLEGRAVEGLGRVQSVAVKSASVVEGAGSARAAGQMVVVGESGSSVRVDGVEVRLVFLLASRLP